MILFQSILISATLRRIFPQTLYRQYMRVRVHKIMIDSLKVSACY